MRRVNVVYLHTWASTMSTKKKRTSETTASDFVWERYGQPKKRERRSKLTFQ